MLMNGFDADGGSCDGNTFFICRCSAFATRSMFSWDLDLVLHIEFLIWSNGEGIAR